MELLAAFESFLYTAEELGHPVQIYHGSEFGLYMPAKRGSVSACSDIVVRPHVPWTPARFRFSPQQKNHLVFHSLPIFFFLNPERISSFNRCVPSFKIF